MTHTCSACGQIAGASGTSHSALAALCPDCLHASKVCLDEQPSTAITDELPTGVMLAQAETVVDLPQIDLRPCPQPARGSGKFRLLAAASLICLASALIVSYSQRSTIADDIDRFAPDHCQLIAVVNDRNVLGSDVASQLNRTLSGAMVSTFHHADQEGGILPWGEQESCIVFAVREEGVDGPLVLIRAREDVHLAGIADRIGVDPTRVESVAGHACYPYSRDFGGVRPTRRMLCLVEARLVLDGTPAAVRAILKRTRTARLSPNLQESLRNVDTSSALALALDGKAFVEDRELAQDLQPTNGFNLHGKDGIFSMTPAGSR